MSMETLQEKYTNDWYIFEQKMIEKYDYLITDGCHFDISLGYIAYKEEIFLSDNKDSSVEDGWNEAYLEHVHDMNKSAFEE